MLSLGISLNIETDTEKVSVDIETEESKVSVSTTRLTISLYRSRDSNPSIINPLGGVGGADFLFPPGKIQASKSDKMHHDINRMWLCSANIVKHISTQVCLLAS
jgi:hypothetical protein